MTFSRISIRPFWKIVPPHCAQDEAGVSIIVQPGEGWGTGAHETTQLCLQAIALFSPPADPDCSSWRMLDFGSGSGILSIGAAKLGASVLGVEIDEAGILNAEENARLNGVTERISFERSLDHATGTYDLIVANILRPVLLAFAGPLTEKLTQGGTLILSGLVATDLPDVSVRYASFLNGRQPEIYQRGDWRALVWRRPQNQYRTAPSR